MNAQNPIRKAIAIPAAGAFSDPIYIGGFQIIVEESPEIVDFAMAATLHVENPTGDGVPLISRTVISHSKGFDRFYVRGNGESAASIVYVLVIPTCELSVVLPPA